MKKSKFKKIIYGLAIMSFLVFSPIAQATDYKLLAPLPGIGAKSADSTNLSSYLPGIFNLAIGLAVALAFVMIVFGGIMYAVSDSISGKQDGKNFLTNAIWGLLIAIGAYTIIYTINPQMLNFDLNIFRPGAQAPASATGITGAPATGKVSCQGVDCIYSYTNSNGTVVSYKKCFNCSLYSSFPTLNFKETFVNGKTAQINTLLGNKLVGLQSMPGTPQFRINESWPPTVNHADQLQYEGASVDISIASPSASSITSFLQNAASRNMYAKYEVSTPEQRDAYIKAGVPASGIIVVPYITGEHFSVK